MPGAVAGWVAKRLPLADDDHRDELAQSMASVVAERPRCERAWESASLVGLWLRLWGRREGGDEARSAVRQGVYLGGLLLAFAASAEAWSHAGNASHSDHAGGAGPAVVVAAGALASGAAALAAGGRRSGALAASAGSMVAGTVATGAPRAVGIVAALALLAGDRFGARRCWRGLASGTLAAGLLAAVAVAVASPGLVPAGEALSLVAVPLAFLIVGWFDPRFAVAATTAWLGAFIALASAWPRGLDDGTGSPNVVGWWLMVVAVVMAAQVSRTALRRAFAV